MRGLSKKQLRKWENQVERISKRKNAFSIMQRLGECRRAEPYTGKHPTTGETVDELMVKLISNTNPNYRLLQEE